MGLSSQDDNAQWLTFVRGIHCWTMVFIMTSSNENIFHVTGLLCGEFTGQRWIPCTKASDTVLWCFLWSAPEPTVEKTMETLVIWDAIRSLWRHCNGRKGLLMWKVISCHDIIMRGLCSFKSHFSKPFIRSFESLFHMFNQMTPMKLENGNRFFLEIPKKQQKLQIWERSLLIDISGLEELIAQCYDLLLNLSWLFMPGMNIYIYCGPISQGIYGLMLLILYKKLLFMSIFFFYVRNFVMCGPFYWHGLILIPAWISDYIHYEIWDENSYPFLNFNSVTVEV